MLLNLGFIILLASAIGFLTDYFAYCTNRNQSDLVEDIVFVLIRPIHLQSQLASRHSKVHSFQLSHRLQCVLLG